jgi:hypothetical protein
MHRPFRILFAGVIVLRHAVRSSNVRLVAADQETLGQKWFRETRREGASVGLEVRIKETDIVFTAWKLAIVATTCTTCTALGRGNNSSKWPVLGYSQRKWTAQSTYKWAPNPRLGGLVRTGSEMTDSDTSQITGASSPASGPMPTTRIHQSS